MPSITSTLLTNDPIQGTVIPIDHGGIVLQTGTVTSAVTAVPGNAGNDPLLLYYDGSRVNMFPIVETFVSTDPHQPLPTSIDVTLTWDGSAQSPVTFSTSGHSAGDSYVLNVQANGVTSVSDAYTWDVSGR